MHKAKFKKNCIKCGIEFFKPINISVSSWFGDQRRPNGTLCCSKKCSSALMIGRPPANKGQTGKVKWSEKRREASILFWHELREASTNKNFSGSKWANTRKHVLVRDNYECQDCGYSEPDIMQVDHILQKSTHPQLMYKSENCITLCPNCHARKTIFEKKNTNYTRKKTCQ